MKMKETLQYAFFLTVLGIWFLSIITIYYPFGLLSTSPLTFPRKIDNSTMTIFLTSSVLSVVSSFFIGLSKLGKLSGLKRLIERHPKN